MNQDNLTKEERKLIKGGQAYRSWKKRVVTGSVAFFLWAFCGIPLTRINDITGIIYTVGLLIIAGMVFYVFVLTCWKCPKCHGKLPKKSMINSGYEPILVKNCPHCGADLTQ